ncbi:CPBP family intramembrane glutamic endopeptidase [Arthrobacter globiformis]|uniref:CPBP family intramembrane glutamic endopeptidase n=1 Tax=Arthrobacter globiformis TaxID=1665 RepID=UPI000B40B95C|nr:type II CAAX endopeptidase family protein [Arthrobacter globiformis]
MIKASRNARAPYQPVRLASSVFGEWGRGHPVAAYVLLAYVMSWSLWALASLTGGAASFVLIVAGGFGPALAAAVMLHITGRSLRNWACSIMAWRVQCRFYAYALLLPAGLQLGMNAALSVGGAAVEWGSLPGRLPGYVASVVVTAVLFGGMEEPGWRGYALPLLQDHHGPVAATALLGLAWGIWHVPLYGPAGFIVPLVLAFFYTWIYNRTGSVLLCILLHGSFTAAQDGLLLTGDSFTVDLTILTFYLLGAATLLVLSRGRLGHPGTAIVDSSQKRIR